MVNLSQIGLILVEVISENKIQYKFPSIGSQVIDTLSESLSFCPSECEKKPVKFNAS